MSRRRRPYTTATPSSSFPEALTAEPIDQSENCRGSKKSDRIWDLIIPTELLQEILSRLGLKENIQASTVCKTWCESAVSVRKLQPRPWLFYPERESKDGTFILFDTLQCKKYKKCFPELKDLFVLSYSRDGWLLVKTYRPSTLVFLLNPFTEERIYLPKELIFSLAFSAAPTSSSCFVISILQVNSCIEIKTWRPGATVWTIHRFETQLLACRWSNCVFSSDSPRLFWMTEHEGDIFAIYIRKNNKKTSVFKLNLEHKVWEEKRDLGGLTVFASYYTSSLTKAGVSREERNKLYTSHDNRFERNDMYYSLSDEKSSHPPSSPYSWSVAWVDPPHNNFSL